MAEHSTLTGASLHEPKGVAGASSGQAYIANGAGSGSWTTVTTASTHASLTDPDLHEPKGVAAAANNEVYVADGAAGGAWQPREVVLNVKMDDISTANSVWVVTPFAGTITKIASVIDGAITTADASITTELGGTPVTGGGLTISFTSSAAGDVDVATPTALNVVSANDAIEIISNGGSTGTVAATFTVVIALS